MNQKPDHSSGLRPDLDDALTRAVADDGLKASSVALASGLAADEFVLEAAVNKANGFDGSAFVTNRRIFLQTQQITGEGTGAFEFFELDNLTNVRVRETDGTSGLICEAFAAWTAWGGFTEKAAQRLGFAARWALTVGREARLAAERPVSSAEMFLEWNHAVGKLQELNRSSDGELDEAQKEAAFAPVLEAVSDKRWWTE